MEGGRRGGWSEGEIADIILYWSKILIGLGNFFGVKRLKNGAEKVKLKIGVKLKKKWKSAER